MADKFFHIEAIGESISFQPPYTMKIQTADGYWVHHVDKNGKPAGGNYYGIEYERGIDELWKELYGDED
jgi:hypothetical protein